MYALKLLFTAIFWGGTFVAGRYLAGEVTPYASAFFRFFIASLVLIPVTWKKQGTMQFGTVQNFFWATFLALLGVVAYNFFFFWGLEHTTASPGIANSCK